MDEVIKYLWYTEFGMAPMLNKIFTFGGMYGDDIDNIWERRNDVFVMDLTTRRWSQYHEDLIQRRAWHRTIVHGSSFIQVGGNTWLEKVQFGLHKYELSSF